MVWKITLISILLSAYLASVAKQHTEMFEKKCDRCRVDSSTKSKENRSNLSPHQKPKTDYCVRYANMKENSQECLKCNDQKLKGKEKEQCENLYDCVSDANQLHNFAECLECKKGWILSPNKHNCFPGIPNCLNYSADSSQEGQFICSLCQPNYQLDFNGQECVRSVIIENCKNYPSNSEGCKECNQGFVLTYNRQKCLPLIPQCLTYSGTLTSNGKLKCESCCEGYVLSVSQTQCLFAVADCLKLFGKDSYTGIATCIICRAGFRPTTDAQKCLPNIPNCLAYENSNRSDFYLSCSRCADNFIPTADKRKCLASIENCISYFDSSITTNRLRCRNCAEDYELSAVFECILSIPNCLAYNTENNHRVSCKQCKGPFQPSPNGLLCIISIENCKNIQIQNDRQTICTECNEGYLLNSNQTFCLLAIANCQNYSDESLTGNSLVCETCNPGFQKANNGLFCLPIILDCAIYQPNVSENNQLICLKCQKGFQVSSDGRSCKRGISNCIKYRRVEGSTDTDFCVQCAPDFLLAADNRDCFASIPGCSAYDNENPQTEFLTCSVCNSGLLLSSDRKACLPNNEQRIIKNCSVYADSSLLVKSKCLVCEDRYVLADDGSFCVLAIENCRRYDFYLGNYKCRECESGYILSSKDHLRCLPTIDNCEVYAESNLNSGFSRCLRCALGYNQHSFGFYCKKNRQSCSKQQSPSKMKKCNVDNLVGKPVIFKRCDDNFFFNFFFKFSMGTNFVISFNASFYSKNSVWKILEAPGSSESSKLYNIAPYFESKQSNYVSFDTDFKLTSEQSSDDAKWIFFKNDSNFYSIQNQNSKLFIDDLGSELNCQTSFEVSVANNLAVNSVGSSKD